MRTRLFALLVIAGVLCAIGPGMAPAKAAPPAPAGELSVAHMEPDAAAALRAKGKPIHPYVPNSANRGKKFNPGGDKIAPVITAPEQKVLVIFAQFTDSPPGGPADRLDLASYFDTMLFGPIYNPPEYAAYPDHPTNATLYNYYKENSYGAVDVVTLNLPSSLGWTQTGHPYAYYAGGNNGFGAYPTNAPGMVIDAIKAVDVTVDFSPYAVNGTVPNLFVVFAGTGAEWSGDPNLIWSHSWDLYWGSDQTLPTAGYKTDDGVYVLNYAVMPEVGGNTTGYYAPVTGPFPPTVGVYADEYGHVLGLPDQYDYGYESEGTGIYSLMASGSWARYPNKPLFSGNLPTHLDAWSKWYLGFLTPMVVTNPANITLGPAETNPDVALMVVPNSGGKEYFLFENRQQIGFDQGLSRLGDIHGLAIYHVDDTVLTRNFWRNAEAENWKEFRSEGWRKAWTGETHYAISISQADDLWQLEHVTSWGDAGDLYPGATGATSFGSYTRPNSSSYYFWGGSDPKYGYSGVTATNIQETVGGSVTFSLSNIPWTPGKSK